MPRVHSLSEVYHTRTTGVLERSTEKKEWGCRELLKIIKTQKYLMMQ